ncbi:MAG: TIGR00266 family protein [Chloroflexi bacterium]|nr:TIGR00266 family protein [Chloroflexota bacterium]
MRYEIQGGMLPSVDVFLEAGESVYTESGGMAWMKGDIDMSTNTRGGLLKGLGRKLAGESLFMTTYACRRGGAQITFTPEAPGSIIAMELDAGESIIAQKDAFMAAQESVEIEMHFRKRLGSGLFGGEGFILQRITGPGVAFFEIVGDVREYDLAPGEVLKVDPGHIALYEPQVDYDITTVKGLTNVLFSGEGLFLATLSGPGKVWLQSMPLRNLAAKLAQFISTKSS